VGIATGCGLEGRSRFSAGVRDVSLLHSSQIAFGVHQASCPLGTAALSLEIRDRSVKITTHLSLVLRSRMMELYLHFPTCPLEMMLN
jgi:hypothetical protein